MWQPSTSKQNLSGIPISLLNNFDPYEILEPQKVLHEEKLIDIETQKPKNNINETATDAISLMPKINPDLVDLFENIFVTPQHIDKIREIDKKINEQMDIISKEMTESSKNDTQSSMCSNCLSNITKDNDAPKVLKPPTLQLNLNTKKKNDNHIEKTLGFNNSVLQTNETGKSMFKNFTQSFYLDSLTNNLQRSEPSDDYEDHEELMDEILQSKCYEVYMREQNETCKQNTATPHIPKANSDAGLSNSLQNHNIDLTKNLKKDNSDQNICTDKHTKLLETVKRDEKLYLKRRIIRSDTSSFTKGPDIQEKSIVTPQLMERLMERKKVLEERNVIKRRLILDTGSCSNNHVSMNTNNNITPMLLNPVVLMEDCNKERLFHFKTREKFENFVRNGRL